MNLLVRFLFAAILTLCGISAAWAQNSTNKGTEFWTAYMDHIDGAGPRGSQMSLYITSDVNTTTTVAIADGSFSQTYNVIANQVTIVDIPASAFLGSFGKYNKGIHITALKPIAVYAHIYASAVSGATLLLPVTTLGKDYQSINYKQLSNSTLPNSNEGPSYSSLMVVATDDNTTVEITPSTPLLDGKPANTPFTVTLQKGEVYQQLANTDLTGTHIKSISANGTACKKIAVFSGSTKIYIGCPNLTSDNLFQQVYPTSTWGKNYITVPLSGRSYDIFRVVVSDPSASVTVNGAPITSIPNTNLQGNKYYEFGANQPNVISSDKPIQVVQYAVTQGNTTDCHNYPEYIGDPEMIYLTPIEQGLDHVTLYSTDRFKIIQSFINVVIPTTAINTFVLDGQPYAASNFTTITGSTYSYSQIPVTSGASHTIKAADLFTAIAYGFGARESYGYAAGTDLKNLNETITLQDAGSNSSSATITNGCTGVDYKIQLTLPFSTTQIKWDFKDGTAPITQNNPVATTLQKGNQTLYVYTFTKNVNFVKGDHTVVASVFNQTADDCGDYEDVEIDFNIADPAVPKFSFTKTCLGDDMAFTDATPAQESAIKNWSWDFGDGSTSTDQNPTHKYASAGDFKVVLTLTNANGCVSVSAPQTVHVTPKPVADFTVSPIDCAGQNVVFTDRSTSSEAATASWSWDFGDGTAPSTIKNPAHIYANAGTYTVGLTVTNANGCASEITKHYVIVNPLPAVDFSIPDVCLADSYAQFKDKTTIADGSEAIFKYSWDFGDAGTSTDKDPKHKYTATGNYNVKLTVTSKSGCVATKTQIVTVNSSDPKAAFSVENINNLCSSDDVIFDDQSSVDVGHITRIDWDFGDGSGIKSYYLSDGTLSSDKKYSHNYGFFSSVNSKTYTVTMKVYSGGVCTDIIAQPIVIHGNPNITIANAPAICQEAAPFQFTVNTNGFTGTGTFTGKGVSSTGLFNPQSAGAGVANINYLFTDTYGCTYTQALQVTVNPTPTVNAGKDVELLQGNSATLNATASGNNLTYKWTPATGLDHDDVLNPVATPLDNTTYTLAVTSADGCVNYSQVSVFVLKLPEIPNTFTPNNDGINDLWYIKHLEDYTDCTVEIFSRNGEKVFYSVGYHVQWDGRYKGQDLPIGVYYYIINPKNGRKTMSGSITIIR